VNKVFAEIFEKQPVEIVNNDYFYKTESEGDQFDEAVANFWLNENGFRDNWEGKRQGRNEVFKWCDEIAEEIANSGKPFMEIACGPGMGLAPAILTKNPKLPCLATDACSLLIKSWRKYLDENLPEYNISLASFSALDMPLKNNSLDYVTSFIGISSTRSGDNGYVKTISEAYRVLKPGGCLVAVEAEWADGAAEKIDEVFKRLGKFNYYAPQNNQLVQTWSEKFIAAGFKIESNTLIQSKTLTKNDCELGEAAHQFGIEIIQNRRLFVLRKV